jgi:hypothetical protein
MYNLKTTFYLTDGLTYTFLYVSWNINDSEYTLFYLNYWFKLLKLLLYQNLVSPFNLNKFLDFLNRLKIKQK